MANPGKWKALYDELLEKYKQARNQLFHKNKEITGLNSDLTKAIEASNDNWDSLSMSKARVENLEATLAEKEEEVGTWKLKYKTAVLAVKEDGLQRIVGAMIEAFGIEQEKLRKAHICECSTEACKLMIDKYHIAMMDLAKARQGEKG